MRPIVTTHLRDLKRRSSILLDGMRVGLGIVGLGCYQELGRQCCGLGVSCMEWDRLVCRGMR